VREVDASIATAARRNVQIPEVIGRRHIFPRGRDRPVRARHTNSSSDANPSKVVMAAKRPDFRRRYRVRAPKSAVTTVAGLPP